MNNQHQFVIKDASGKDIDRFGGTMTDARRRGNALATALGKPVTVYAYNDMLYKWDKLATYLGSMNVIDSFGDRRVIKSDFAGFEPRKEAAV